jgi:hypothetical protein
MGSERSQRRLTKVRNGTWTTLWSDSTAYELNRTYVLEIIANGNTLTVKLDGVQLWSGTNSQHLTTGTVAMYSWQNTGAQFDNILVRNLSVPLASAPPPLLPQLPRSLMARLSEHHREPAPAPDPSPEPLRVAMWSPRFDAFSTGSQP